MKTIIIVVLVVVLSGTVCAQENILSKKITISFNHIELQQALKELQIKSGVSIAYNNKLQGMQTEVNESFKEKSLEVVLTTLLKKEKLDYKVIGNQITIFQKKSDQPVLKGKKGSINGMVIDKKSNEPLSFINVILVGTNTGTMTDLEGRFIIEDLAPGNYNLVISAIGYTQEKVDNVNVSSNEKVDLGIISMLEGVITLNEVTISPGSFSVMSSKPLSAQTLTERDIKNMSFSEDITRAVSRLPGVSSNDFSSKFTVRGGETDEVLITLDGMELYDPFHQRDFAGGLFSIVDIETVQGIDLLTGGFSAEYGNRQSAVFNMKTKKVTEKRNSSIGLSIMNARLYSEGTYASGKGSYVISARRGMLDQTFKLIGQTENIPVFYDMFGRIDYKIGEKHTLSLHALNAGDRTEVRDISDEAYDIHDTKYGNTYGWLTLQSIYNEKLSSRSILYGGLLSQLRKGNTEKDEPSDKVRFLLTDERNLSFFGAKQDWKWFPIEKISIMGGFDVKQLNSDYNYSLSLNDIRTDSTGVVGVYNEERKIVEKPTGQQLGVYLSGRFTLLSKLFLETGLRYDVISYTNESFISPRVGIAYALSKNTFLRAAWGHYYQPQFIYNMEVNYGVESFREAEMAEHYVFGLEHLFPKGFNIRIEGYYKDISLPSVNYQNLRDPWEVFPETRNDVVKLNISGAKAKGIELFAKYDVGKNISCWFSYALAKAEEKVESLEFNGLLEKQTGWLPRINNQYHTVYFDFNYRLNKKWNTNLSWQYYKGWPQTIYEYDFVTLPDESLHFYPNHTKFRGEEFPAYHRMDLRVNRHFYLDKSKISAYVHIINLYNHENLRKFDLDVTNDQGELMPNGQEGYLYARDDKNWFGLTPVIGISWEF